MADPLDLDFGATIRAFSPEQRVFSRFTLIRLLGRGGMGVVWLARDDKLEREVALKFLPEAVALDPRAVDDLKRETRRSLELTHPNIVRIYDFFEDNSAAAISLEYVAGGTLAKLAVEQPSRCYEPDQILSWIGQLVDGLEYAHERAQIVHRDLKPANLMVDEKRNLKITDFGISATVTDSVTRVSRLASSGATPAYASPQQVMGERPSPLDDVYSLGSSIFDLVTGRPPFHSGNLLVQVQSKIAPTMTERRAELGVKGKKIPANWEQTVAACLAKDPAARPRSARAVWDGLQGRGLKLGLESAPVVADIPAASNGSGSAETPVEQPVAPPPPPPPPPSPPPATPKNLGHVFAAFWAMMAGRRGLVPQLIALLVPLALLAWGLTIILGRGASGTPGKPMVTYSPNGPAATQAELPAAGQGSASPADTSSGERAPVTTPPSGGTSAAVRQNDDRASTAAVATDPSTAAGQTTSAKPHQPVTELSPTTPPAEVRPYVPPPPAPLATGTVRISSEPAGASVWFAGRELGRTPLSLDVLSGPVEYTLKLHGYEDMRVEAEARAQRTLEIAAPLRALPESRNTRDILVPDLQMTMIEIEPGEFLMGSPSSEVGPDSDERPQTRVRISHSFWIGQTEVTQSQWQTLMGDDPSAGRSGGGAAPVDRVSWSDAERFCARLTERERAAGRVPAGYVYCLPTEAQWEYACRAGTTGPYAGDAPQMAWANRRGSSPRAVAQGQPNPWGLYDMHGNVAEWTASWYADYPGGSADNYAGPRSGKARVFRGGAFDSPLTAVRSAYRSYVSGGTGAPNRGFRVALAPQR